MTAHNNDAQTRNAAVTRSYAKQLERGIAEPIEHPGGSACAQKCWPDEIHADAFWTTPKALCNLDAPIHPDDITRDDERVTCVECRELLDDIAAMHKGNRS
jgi:hypothetical protein